MIRKIMCRIFGHKISFSDWIGFMWKIEIEKQLGTDSGLSYLRRRRCTLSVDSEHGKESFRYIPTDWLCIYHMSRLGRI